MVFQHYRIRDIYYSIKYRCQNPAHSKYLHYGAKGIRLCEEWLDSKNFVDWAYSNGYSDDGYDLVLIRLDKSKGYNPDNCKWVNKSEAIEYNKTHKAKKSSKIYVEYNNKQYSLKELSKVTGLSYNLLIKRYNKGETGDKLVRKAKGSI